MIWNVRLGKCLVNRAVHGDVGCGLVFTPDGKGLISASWDKVVIRWDLSWLKSTDFQKEDSSTKESTDGLKEISRFLGHTVCPRSILRAVLSRSNRVLRTVFTLFLYHPMVIGLRLAQLTRLLESGMLILLPCSVSCMVIDQLCPSISIAAGIISQSRIRKDK